jgi:hypothetical protein
MKWILVIGFLCTAIGLMAEEFTFEVIHETPYYYRDEYENDLPKYAGMMQIGEEIKTDNSIGYKQIKNPPGTEVVVHFVSTENANFFTVAENLVPKSSVSLLRVMIF